MPSVETFDCTMDGVYWESARYDNYGEFKVLPPEAILVRWNKDTRDRLDAEGHVIVREALVSCLTPLRVGSILWEGAIGDLPGSPSPLYQIDSDLTKKDIKNRASRYLYSLSRFSDDLPIMVSGTGS